MLPKAIYSIFVLLPFTYTLYFPLRIYLGQASWSEIGLGLVVSLVWIGILYKITQLVWRRGLRVYTAVGR